MSKSSSPAASNGTTGRTRTLTKFVAGRDPDGSNVREAIRAVEAHPELDPAILGDRVTSEAVDLYWLARRRLEAARKARDEADKLFDATIPRDETGRNRVNYLVSVGWERWVSLAWHEFNEAERNLIRVVYLWSRGIEVPARLNDDDFEWTPASVRLDGTFYTVVPDDEDDPTGNPRLVVINPQDFAYVDPCESDEPDDG